MKEDANSKLTWKSIFCIATSAIARAAPVGKGSKSMHPRHSRFHPDANGCEHRNAGKPGPGTLFPYWKCWYPTGFNSYCASHALLGSHTYSRNSRSTRNWLTRPTYRRGKGIRDKGPPRGRPWMAVQHARPRLLGWQILPAGGLDREQQLPVTLGLALPALP
eukprot:6491958-Amphidinium_carterae.3